VIDYSYRLFTWLDMIDIFNVHTFRKGRGIRKSVCFIIVLLIVILLIIMNSPLVVFLYDGIVVLYHMLLGYCVDSQ